MSRMATPGSLLPGGFTLGPLSHADRVSLIYEALPVDDDGPRKAAAQVLHPLHVDELRDWFEKTAALGRSLKHPNLVEVYALGYTHNDLPVVVTEWVEGRSVRARLASGEVFPVGEVLRIVREVASALDYLHGRATPVLHRVVMPETVMLTSSGGMVKLLAVGHADRPVHPAAKPSHQSPEELEGHALSPASDVFSLASLAFEVLTGRPAFVGNATSVLTAVHRGALPWVATTPSEALVPLDDALHRAWSLDPRERFATAGAFAAAFEEAVQRVPSVILSTRRAIREGSPLRGNTLPPPLGQPASGSVYPPGMAFSQPPARMGAWGPQRGSDRPPPNTLRAQTPVPVQGRGPQRVLTPLQSVPPGARNSPSSMGYPRIATPLQTGQGPQPVGRPSSRPPPGGPVLEAVVPGAPRVPSGLTPAIMDSLAAAVTGEADLPAVRGSRPDRESEPQAVDGEARESAPEATTTSRPPEVFEAPDATLVFDDVEIADPDVLEALLEDVTDQWTMDGDAALHGSIVDTGDLPTDIHEASAKVAEIRRRHRAEAQAQARAQAQAQARAAAAEREGRPRWPPSAPVAPGAGLAMGARARSVVASLPAPAGAGASAGTVTEGAARATPQPEALPVDRKDWQKWAPGEVKPEPAPWSEREIKLTPAVLVAIMAGNAVVSAVIAWAALVFGR